MFKCDMRFLLLAFALGICGCQQLAALPPLRSLLLGIVVLAVGALLLRQIFQQRHVRAFACILGCGAAVLAGLAYADWRATLRLAEALPTALEGSDFIVSGYVADLPDRGERGTRFVFHADQRPIGVPENLSLSWYADGKQAIPVLRAGERWQLTVRVRRPHGNLNPYGFDFEGWMFERDIRAVGYVRNRDLNRRTSDLADGLMPRVQRVRQVVRERFERVLPQGPWVGVLSALAVGDQSAVSAQQWRLFSQTGVTHLMSIT